MPAFRVKLLTSICFASLVIVAPVHAQNAAVPEHMHGTLITIPAMGEVTYPNDEGHITLSIEEQDKDKSVAASHVNAKMKQGTDIVKQDDPGAILKTRGYYTYPVYANDVSSAPNNKLKQPIGWRVGQYLDVTTTNLAGLSKLAADAQQLMSLNNVHFGLSRATSKKLDQQQIEAAYQNLSDRIAFIAKAMGKNANEAVLESVDFDPSAAQASFPRPAMQFAARVAAPVEEPSFEPGETTQELHVVGKVLFK